jgi:hypothetical protein
MPDKQEKQIDLDKSEWRESGEPESYQYEWQQKWKKTPGEQPPFKGYITDGYDLFALVVVIGVLVWFKNSDYAPAFYAWVKSITG